ncbi:hypothetical protein LWF01_04390 [Saxibacter everestensis]|uniref:Uncharacterized protein n=1 Tax=Saxibacter everestensis TaxID=2909229 RepID=A0ABY8QXB0_9MICO|nr:hypothetical protein LWF01_04390 [Brevibacteriaceae bacterium ZFBP1038]
MFSPRQAQDESVLDHVETAAETPDVDRLAYDPGLIRRRARYRAGARPEARPGG